MADQQHVAAALVVDLGLAVDLGHQRAGRVDGGQPAGIRVLRHGLGHAVGGEDHRGLAVRHLVELGDEDRAFALQALDHVLVVHDLVPHVDGRAVEGQGALDHVDGPHHAGAEPARRAEEDLEGRLRGRGGTGVGLVHGGAHDPGCGEAGRSLSTSCATQSWRSIGRARDGSPAARARRSARDTHTGYAKRGEDRVSPAARFGVRGGLSRPRTRENPARWRPPPTTPASCRRS